MSASRKARSRISPLLNAVRTELQSLADAERAVQQQAYMKSAMPYHGVIAPVVAKLAKRIIATLEFADVQAYLAAVRDIWHGATHREERYFALELMNARRFAPLRNRSAATELEELYEELVVSGAWWDLIDGFAPARLAELQEIHAARAKALLRRWAKHDDIWLRRAAILSQMKRKADTDAKLLEDIISASFGHPEFFVRKAIGWALREYAYLQPDWVRSFVAEHSTQLSALSQREAIKHVPSVPGTAPKRRVGRPANAKPRPKRSIHS